ncbi:hypothetical protein AB1Y20_006449 [Prymnesium parvum]|uniref:PNPLA domain-containing protein n=1 Tax=Prymnesium parvum TaxID=97485 RepID=A0AB34IY55_PRYPA
MEGKKQPKKPSRSSATTMIKKRHKERDYEIDDLKKMAAQVLSGEMPSARAAALAAGLPHAERSLNRYVKQVRENTALQCESPTETAAAQLQHVSGLEFKEKGNPDICGRRLFTEDELEYFARALKLSSSHAALLSACDSPPPPLRRRVSSHGLLAQRELDPPPPSFFFTGCAWGCGYHVGAYRAMIERWGLAALRSCSFGGNSAGVLIALCAAQGLAWEVAEALYLELVDRAVAGGVVGKMSRYHAAALERLVGPDTHTQLAGRLFVGVSYFPFKYEVSSSWRSREELINTVHASMHIPFYCQHIETVNGRRACDGGLASPYHIIHPPSPTCRGTLIVDPFAKSSLSIVRLEPIFPLVGRRYSEVASEGRKDMLRLQQPAPYPLVWPSPVVLLTWLARAAEELLTYERARLLLRCVLLLLVLRFRRRARDALAKGAVLWRYGGLVGWSGAGKLR